MNGRLTLALDRTELGVVYAALTVFRDEKKGVLADHTLAVLDGALAMIEGQQPGVVAAVDQVMAELRDRKRGA